MYDYDLGQPVHSPFVCVLNGLLAGRTARPAGEQTGQANSMVVLTDESDRGRFGCRYCQQIGRPMRVSAARFVGRTYRTTNLCLIFIPNRNM